MSGGHFDHSQYRMNDIAVEIDYLEQIGDYNRKIKSVMRFTVKLIGICLELINAIDWLVSGDIGEEIFINRVRNILKNI